MKELTDLEICTYIAKIEGVENIRISIPVNRQECDFELFNPLIDKALCFDLMVKYEITPSKTVVGSGYLASFFTDVNCSGQLKEIFSQDPQRAICLAIIAQHRLKGDIE